MESIIDYGKFLKGKPKNFQSFFKYSLDYLTKHGKVIKIFKNEYLYEDGDKYGGYCDGREIGIAGKNKSFQELYVHEFSHMMQCVQESSLWYDVEDAKFWKALSKKSIDVNNWQQLYGLILLERDCERRAINISKKWELFDNEKYAREANTYLLYYHYVFLKKKWINSNKIFEKEIIDSMPNKLFTVKSLKTIDMDKMLLYDKYVG